MGHTPGPWFMAMEPDGDMEEDFPGHYVGGFNGGEVYNGGGVFAYDKDITKEALDAGEDPVIEITGRVYDEDDAYLISAAPDLLAACKMALQFIGRDRYRHDEEEPIEMLNAAIQKAEGK